MSDITLSVVVPAFNEEARILHCIDELTSYLHASGVTWELIVADDGSADRTAVLVASVAAREPRITLIRGDHAGKGAAVRRGMMAARGTWCLMADADLSMPPHNIDRFFDAVAGTSSCAQIAIGSREAPGSRRVNEPWPRHLVGTPARCLWR